jgi:hypothetical protein
LITFLSGEPMPAIEALKPKVSWSILALFFFLIQDLLMLLLQ